jgi:hypothetical protein
MLRAPTTHFISASFSFEAGIDMIWHQMPAVLAIAAAFFHHCIAAVPQTVVQTA